MVAVTFFTNVSIIQDKSRECNQKLTSVNDGFPTLCTARPGRSLTIYTKVLPYKNDRLFTANKTPRFLYRMTIDKSITKI